MIPGAAVEAALAALFPGQETVSDFSRAVQVPSIRTILEAAAPHMLREAQERAYNAGHLDGMNGSPNSNPYWRHK